MALTSIGSQDLKDSECVTVKLLFVQQHKVEYRTLSIVKTTERKHGFITTYV